MLQAILEVFVLLRVKLANARSHIQGCDYWGLGEAPLPTAAAGGSAGCRHCSGSSQLNPQPEVPQPCSVGCPASQPLICSQAASSSPKCFLFFPFHQLLHPPPWFLFSFIDVLLCLERNPSSFPYLKQIRTFKPFLVGCVTQIFILCSRIPHTTPPQQGLPASLLLAPCWRSSNPFCCPAVLLLVQVARR